MVPLTIRFCAARLGQSLGALQNLPTCTGCLNLGDLSRSPARQRVEGGAGGGTLSRGWPLFDPVATTETFLYQQHFSSQYRWPISIGAPRFSPPSASDSSSSCSTWLPDGQLASISDFAAIFAAAFESNGSKFQLRILTIPLWATARQPFKSASFTRWSAI